MFPAQLVFSGSFWTLIPEHYQGRNDGNSFLDVDGQIEFSPIPLVGIFAGYRYLDLEVDESGVFIDATLDGPYAGALVRF